MKIQTVSYIFREGCKSVYKNRLMSMISMSMVAVSLVIFGIYYFVMVNLTYNVNKMQENYEIRVFCVQELNYNDPLTDEVEEAIRAIPNVTSVVRQTREESWERLHGLLGEDMDSNMLEGIPNTILPISFVVQIEDFAQGAETGEAIREIRNVDDILLDYMELVLLERAANWIYVASVAVGLIFMVAAIFIIANTIRLTVFSRQREINIMKYVGANDSFVRGPFLLEGALIGAIGAVFAFVIAGYGYATITRRINEALWGANITAFSIYQLSEVWQLLFAIMLVIGIVVGFIGSAISVRKYLKV